MTIGNMIALRQTNVIRMLAYSGVAQAGFMLAPLAVGSDLSARAVVTYLVIYAAMNLGAFAVVIAIARKTRSAEIDELRRPVRVRPRPHRASCRCSCSAWPASRRSAAGWPSSWCSARWPTPTPRRATCSAPSSPSTR